MSGDSPRIDVLICGVGERAQKLGKAVLLLQEKSSYGWLSGGWLLLTKGVAYLHCVHA